MKKLVLTAVASLACLAAFAQGKIGFQNDSLHLVAWGAGAGALSGTPVNSDNMPTNLTGLSVDLYMGTSSSTLFLYSSTTFGTIANGQGKWLATSVLANASASGGPAIPSGSVFVEVQIRSTEHAADGIFTGVNDKGYGAYGISPEFNFTLGTGVTYPVMWGANGNWPVGTIPMDSVAPGARGAFVVSVPEPTSFALAGLGAAAMLIFRRRK